MFDGTEVGAHLSIHKPEDQAHRRMVLYVWYAIGSKLTFWLQYDISFMYLEYRKEPYRQ